MNDATLIFCFLYLIKTTLVQFGRSLNCVRATLFYLSGLASCPSSKEHTMPFWDMYIIYMLTICLKI